MATEYYDCILTRAEAELILESLDTHVSKTKKAYKHDLRRIRRIRDELERFVDKIPRVRHISELANNLDKEFKE